MLGGSKKATLIINSANEQVHARCPVRAADARVLITLSRYVTARLSVAPFSRSEGLLWLDWRALCPKGRALS